MTRAVLFVGGGTGGHLYPALAIIDELRALDPGARAAIACSTRPIDADILRPTAVDFTPIPASPPIPRPAPLIRFLRAWRPSVRALRAMIRALGAEADDVTVVAMGGFVSAPSAAAARREGAPLVLVNLDAVPGRANRFLARRAERVFTAAPVPDRADWIPIPPIVRRAMLDPIEPRDARRALGLDPETRTLLVTGGSQGARTINELLAALTRADPDALKGWQVLHQSGADGAGLERAYQRAGVPAIVTAYIDDMRAALGAADLAVGRCGAGAVAECWATRTPALFLPYPYHKDDHQRANARVLERAGAAIVRTDHADADANLAGAGAALGALLRDPERIASMRRANESLAHADGAARLARALASP